MRTYMARLGGFQFSLDTAAFKELQRASQYRWEIKERINREPALQFVGVGSELVTLSGVIYPHFRGGLRQVAGMRSEASRGTPLPFVYADEFTGQFLGNWCIEEIEEKRTVFFEDGTPRAIEFRIAIRKYGDDDLGLSATVQLSPSVPTLDLSTGTSSAASAVSVANAVTDQAGAFSAVQSVLTATQDMASGVSSTINSVLNSDAVKLVRGAVQDVADLKQTVGAITNAAGVLRSASGALATLDALGGVVSVANSTFDTVGQISDRLTDAQSLYNAMSPSSLFSKQIASATKTLNQISNTADGVKLAANKLRGYF